MYSIKHRGAIDEGLFTELTNVFPTQIWKNPMKINVFSSGNMYINTYLLLLRRQVNGDSEVEMQII